MGWFLQALQAGCNWCRDELPGLALLDELCWAELSVRPSWVFGVGLPISQGDHFALRAGLGLPLFHEVHLAQEFGWCWEVYLACP